VSIPWPFNQGEEREVAATAKTGRLWNDTAVLFSIALVPVADDAASHAKVLANGIRL
jgi:hypothetical protein